MRLRTFLLVALLVAVSTPVLAQRPRTSGSITTLNGAVTLSVGQADGTATALVSAVCSCTLTFEVSIDGTTWTAQAQTQNLATGAIGSTTTGTGTYVLPVSGHQRARVRASAYTSGTATIVLGASAAPSLIAQGGIWSQRVQDGIGNALTSKLAGSERAISVAVVDSSGNQVSSFGGAGGTASNFTSGFPSTGTAIGFSDGTNMQGARVVDLDTSGATQYGLITNLVRRASGGSAELIGQATMTNSLPVAIASDQSAIASNLTQLLGVALSVGNGASGTGVQRFTLANDSTGVLASIGAVTTSVTPGTSAAHLGKAEDAVAGSGDTGVAFLAQREDTPSATAANNDYIVPKTDGVGRLWMNCGAGCSGGTQYAEDVASAGGETTTLAGAIRQDTPSSTTSTDGDITNLKTDANSFLRVNPFGVTQAASSYLTVRLSDGTNFSLVGTDYTHDAALTMASSAGPLLMARASAAAPSNVSAGDDAVAIWALLNGSLVTNLAAGGTLITATSTSLNVNCTGGCSGGTQYAEDSAHVSTDTVTLAGVVQQSADAALSSDGDRSLLQVDANGFLKVNIKAGAGSGGTAMADDAAFTVATTSFTPAGGTYKSTRDLVDDNDGGAFAMTQRRAVYATLETANGDALFDETGDYVKVGDGTGALSIDGTVTAAGGAAHDAAVSGNPNLIGGYASAAAPSDVSGDGDAVRAWMLRSGATVTQPTFAGTLATVNNGVAGVGVQRVAIASDNSAVSGMGVGATGAAVPANANYLAGRAGANLEALSACGSQQTLRMTTATTTELVAAPGAGRVRFCSLRVFAEGATNVTIVRGTGSNCATGTATVDGPYGVGSATTGPGFQAGIGLSTIMDAGADTAAVCITSSAAVGLTVFARYTTY